ncbi:DinB family protein [Streptomyces sp. NPDC048623]|uniref:DinB family protein n=1 Tax=Streptomyces sp. NPDC048623 TaxID=3155761 RepID=UPI00342472A0
MVALVPAEKYGDERGALLNFIEAQRAAVVRASFGLTEEQAASRPSASELSLSGLIKHVAEAELNWLRMAQRQPNELRRDESNWHESFQLVGDETVASTVAFMADVAKQTEDFVRSVPSLDEEFPLPDKPWFPKDGRVSVRWMLLHLIQETGRHAGHADIIRESLDGKGSFELIALESELERELEREPESKAQA